MFSGDRPVFVSSLFLCVEHEAPEVWRDWGRDRILVSNKIQYFHGNGYNSKKILRHKYLKDIIFYYCGNFVHRLREVVKVRLGQESTLTWDVLTLPHPLSLSTLKKRKKDTSRTRYVHVL